MSSLTHPSPHFNSRGGKPIRCIVLHSTAGASDKGDLSWMQSPESKVSYHTCIGRQGQVYTLVDPAQRAWHAGKSEWRGVKDVNSISLGLAFCNKHNSKEALTPLQIAAAKEVVAEWRALYPTIEDVTSHHFIAPTRKRDPLDSPGFTLSDYL